MPSFAVHCFQAKQSFGKPYEEVHEWLDHYFGHARYGARHRRKRHHLAGIAEVRRKWGAEAAAAARQHIIADLQMEGWKEGDPFPKDENDYVKLGFF